MRHIDLLIIAAFAFVGALIWVVWELTDQWRSDWQTKRRTARIKRDWEAARTFHTRISLDCHEMTLFYGCAVDARNIMRRLPSVEALAAYPAYISEELLFTRQQRDTLAFCRRRSGYAAKQTSEKP